MDTTQVKVARARRRSFRLRLLVRGSGRPGVGDLMPVFGGKEIPEDGQKCPQEKKKGSNRLLTVAVTSCGYYETGTCTMEEM